MTEPRTEIVLPGKPMTETLTFFRETLGLQLESIMPADDPQIARLTGGGMRVELHAGYEGDPGLLQMTSDEARAEICAPNGTRIRFVAAKEPLNIPTADDVAVITTRASGDDWVVGRAGMLYRDLIPGRMNGHLIASHIRIPDGGPVPDNVHFHDVRFQMIYCYRGWVRLVYEDQGEPFVMQAGDCVLQPPEIRHRVLESSHGLEVIELACPSAHLTTLDHQLELPTNNVRPDRNWAGQRFHFHQHAHAEWTVDDATGWSKADLGIAAASGQVADVDVLRASKATQTADQLSFLFVLTGSCQITVAPHAATELAAADCATIPRNTEFALQDCSDDLQLLRVRLA
ncbi:MAG: quercetin dioxygenase-like cupin family protein [Planctomycetota bacterium]|jgi:quercetin dioxygenase-like cupin family protein